MSRIRVYHAAALVALIVFAAGCGSSKSSTTGTTSAEKTATPGITQQKDSKIAAEVPKAISSTGALKVALDAEYAPDEFIAKDGHTIVGMDADLTRALAEVMGLKFEPKNVVFEDIIPGLAAKKYDMGASSFTATKEREKTVDFVTYANVGSSFYIKAQGGPDIKSLADLCGHKVSAQKSTTQADDATAQDKKCKAAGKPGVTLSVFPDQNSVNLALSSGRVEVAMADSPVAAYAAEQSSGQFKLTGNQYGAAAYGLAMPKGSGLDKSVLDGVKKLIANGTYQKIFEYWGLTRAGGANGCPCTITNPEINPTNVPVS